MKKVTLYFWLIALIGTGAAWINKPPRTGKFLPHRFSVKLKDGTKYYWEYDITSLGWVEGVNYDCLPPNGATCTFAADPINDQADAGGHYFNSWDILSASFEAGTWTLD